LENLTGILRNNSYEEFSALKTISLKVKKDETSGIIGENGSGKSTLLKILAGVLQPDTGIVKVVGKIAPFLELGVGFQPDERIGAGIAPYTLRHLRLRGLISERLFL
jgi:lipopolysaccharide transport system ATP-binding protein